MRFLTMLSLSVAIVGALFLATYDPTKLSRREYDRFKFDLLENKVEIMDRMNTDTHLPLEKKREILTDLLEKASK